MGENYISCQLENGSIKISEDVVNSMVKTAVAEVEGVWCLAVMCEKKNSAVDNSGIEFSSQAEFGGLG